MSLRIRPSTATRSRRMARFAVLALLLAGLACSMPFSSTPTPTRYVPSATPSLVPTATPTPIPQPPALVESDPPVSAELPLTGPLTLYFNQAMDRASVEAVLRSQMGEDLSFTWIDNATVVVTLPAPLQPDSELAVLVSDDMRSSQGKPLFQTVSLNYRTAGYLAVSLQLPENNTQDVDPTGAVIVAFNRPIVALGAGPEANLPPGFSLTPQAQGRGAWINTSTYAFYPEPALAGGTQYTVQVNPDLKSADGGPLQDIPAWSFTTSVPRLLTVEPSTETPWPLDAKVTLKFNQPMDTAAVEAAFSLAGPDGAPVPGTFEWNEAEDTLTFTPSGLLARGAILRLGLSAQAQGRGGAPLDAPSSIEVTTVEALRVTRTEPDGAPLEPTNSLAIFFSAPLANTALEKWVTLEPAVANMNVYWDESQYVLRLNAAFAPNTAYTLRLSPDLADRWGGTLGQEYTFTFSTGPYQPNLSLITQASAIFLTGQDAALRAQAVNLPELPMTLGPLSLAEFMSMNAPDGYEQRETLLARQAATWTQALNAPADRMGPVDIYLNPEQTPLTPGIYFFRFNFPREAGGGSIYNGPFMLVVSNLQLTLKTGATDALVWAADIATGAPAAGATVTLYDENGNAVAQGQTDAQGIFRTSYETQESPYASLYAVINQPGDPNFGMAVSSWSAGLEAWDYGITSQVVKPGLKTYFYTDRPIYRPGQKVYFRAIVRQAFNGRYTPPEISALPVTITGNEGQELAAFDLPISPLGTAHGEYAIPAEAAPGYYSINAKDQESSLGFQVASYRKPEINLQAAFAGENVQAGEKLTATVSARYFFDAPAGNLPLRWSLYKHRAYFSLPGYQVGREDLSWMDAFRMPAWVGDLGQLVTEGDAKTAPDGTVTLEWNDAKAGDLLEEYAVEITATDESGLPVSTRATVRVNPDAFYIGVRPEAWVGRAGEETGYEILTVDWQKEPVGSRELRAVFQKVVWQRIPPPANQPFEAATYEPQFTPVGSTDLATGPDGKARVAFTPPEPGTYMLDVFNRQTPEGQGARTQSLVWVGGAGQAVWPNLPNSRLHLTADRDEYLPGDTAQVFIPNPMGRDVQALITVERSVVMKYELVTIPAEGYTLSLELPEEYAPNVYLSVMLLGGNDAGRPDFRQGYLNLKVSPVNHELQVAVTGQPERAGPGDTVDFEIQVTDAGGQPVQGEFSLAVVDLAALALADPNSKEIVPAFYGEQPLGVRTGTALAAYNLRALEMPGGLGGGGGAEAPQVARENFPDTAYWNAQVQTGPDGKAQVSVTLPDTLTTWQVDTRGVTEDTRVGQAQTQIVTTKELLVRPVTPRFFVAQDHALLAAVVQNNTGQELEAQVALQANGFSLDDRGAQLQSVSVPAHGRARVEWWGVVEDVDAVELVFSADGGGFRDAARPAAGALPVLRYFTPQAFRTSGIMDTGGELTELVSLPRSFDPGSGQLSVELSPSLAAAMRRALDVLETQPYESTEAALSSFLPNLETYRTLQQFGVEDAGLQSKLDRSLNSGLQRLLARQNFDGGWGWWQGNESDPFITTYVLFGLLRAREAGVGINPEVIQKAVGYLQERLPAQAQGAGGAKLWAQVPGGDWPAQPWQWDRLAFQVYVLSEAGSPDQAAIDAALGARDQLSPWAQALLALTLERQQPGSAQAQTILAELQATAVRSASGAFWALPQNEAGMASAGYNMQNDLTNTAVTLFALAQRDPNSPLVADGVRYLMSARGADGAWDSSYTTAWALMALNEVMKGTGEMAGKFAFQADLNNAPLAQGQAADAQQVNPVTAQTPISRLYPDDPNALVIRRGDGPGRLYYTAGLEVSRPVEDVVPLSQGLSIERAVFPFGDACPDRNCSAIASAEAGQKVTVRLALTLPNPAHFLAVADYIPAGAEILNVTLKTSELGVDGEPQAQANYDPRRPFDRGWGWWLFNEPQIYDNRILWTTSYLAAGSYELTYTLVLMQPGEYRVLPARAWQMYFPDVQANSAGSTFEILP